MARTRAATSSFLSRELSSNDSSNDVDKEREKDAVLLSAFHNKMPLEFIFTSEGLEQHIKNFDRQIISQVQLFNGVAISWALTNPLLKKYDFNAEDFLVGAEQALREVTRALVSRDLFEYATNINCKKSESADFLSKVLYPFQYHSVMSSLRANKFNGLPFRNLPAEAVIHRSYIVDMHTYMVDEQMIEDRKASDEELQALLKADMIIPEGVEDESAIDKTWEMATRARTFAYSGTTEKDASTSNSSPDVLTMPHFPLGSVLTAVKVRYDCEFKMGEDDEAFNSQTAATAQKNESVAVKSKSNDDTLEPPSAAEVPEPAAKVDTGHVDPPLDDEASATSLGLDTEWAALSNDEKLLTAGMAGTRSMEWVLIGCISGQVPLEYKIASFGVPAEQQ